MSNDVAIKVTNLSKLYHLGEHAARAPYKTLRDSLAGLFRFSPRKADGRTSSAAGNAGTSVSPSSSSGSHTPSDSESLCFNKSASDELWALKDVYFEIDRGEVVGIIVTQRR